MKFASSLLLVLGAVSQVFGQSNQGWKLHTIDDTSRGADGVRVADVNGDGRPDLCTGWEEGASVRVYLHPGIHKVRESWPRVVVGNVKSPEDAVFVDLDRDGAVDVISCCEGKNRSIYVHWAPRRNERYLSSADWKQQVVPITEKQQSWMFALPRPAARGPIELIVGSKGKSATVSRLLVSEDPRQVERWTLQPLYRAGWIMSLVNVDMDADGDLDVLVSDRKGINRGVLWLENRPPQQDKAWPIHRIGGADHEVMFLCVADLDQDGAEDVVCATRNQQILVFYRGSVDGRKWRQQAVPNPGNVPHGKAVAVGDIDGDGRPDLVHTTNTGGNRSQPGVTWMKATGNRESPWMTHNISGPRGVKFDLIQLLDLDGDGDLDVLTCEERDNLGLVWYENPGNER